MPKATNHQGTDLFAVKNELESAPFEVFMEMRMRIKKYTNKIPSAK
jgi:hypothetical protein